MEGIKDWFSEITDERHSGHTEHKLSDILVIVMCGVLCGIDGLQSVFSVRRIITAKGKTTDETCYYITSLDTTAQELLRITRAHWKIESLHWLLDVTFSEDNCTILSENGQKTLNALRKPAISLHKQFSEAQPKKCSIKAGLFSCLLNDYRLCEILGSL